MGNGNVDWSKAPPEADGWMWDSAGGPIWVRFVRDAFAMADTLDAEPQRRDIAVPVGPAPAFGWTAADGGTWEVTRRP